MTNALKYNFQHVFHDFFSLILMHVAGHVFDEPWTYEKQCFILVITKHCMVKKYFIIYRMARWIVIKCNLCILIAY